ncbi:hypothetical protein [Lysobacter gummosus]|uniref:Uncharacterized protein n=1 Tax=Lysobacter gummosus TaxID=262324 RepID=A0ABY3XJ23_9GAMM|nr:hypothetical protein [Lysobacter gummosus]UNP31642.1 hypothetical protein MOV92_10510 [Lysobacter gummosus]
MSTQRRWRPLLTAALLLASSGAWAASVQPTTYPGNFTSCNDLPGVGTWQGLGSSTGGAPVNGQSYNLGLPGQSITFNYTPSGQNQYIGFNATVPMDYIVVKGGNAYNVFHYDPAVSADINLYSPDNGSGEPAGVSHVAFCFLPKPSGEKTADASWKRYTDWSIDKSVTPEQITMFDGDSHQVEYTVTATPLTRGIYRVSGTITVKDPFDFGWKATAVVDTMQFGNAPNQFALQWTAQGGDTDTLDCTKPAPNAQKIILACSYAFDLSSLSHPFLLNASGGVNAAGITTQRNGSCGCADDGSSGGSPGSAQSYTFTATAAFTIPANPAESYGDSFSVDDSMLPNAVDHSFALGDAGYVWTYGRPQPFACDADGGSHNNTATGSWSTGANTNATASDSASVNVACRTVSISKTAQTRYDRDYGWSADKHIVVSPADAKVTGMQGCLADPIASGDYAGNYLCDDIDVTLNDGGSYETVYRLAATRGIESESGFAVSGDIQVNWPVDVTPVFSPSAPSDVLHFAGGTTQSVSPTCDAQGPTSLHCAYQASLSGKLDGYNQASIQRVRQCYDANGAASDCGLQAYDSNQAALAYGDPNVETDRCVVLTDLFNGTAGLNLGTGFGWTVQPLLCGSFVHYATGDVDPDPDMVRSLDVFASWLLPSQTGAGNSCEFMVPNLLTLATDNGANKSDEAVLSVRVPELCANAGCTYTLGYWKTHSTYGPAPYDATWAAIGENTLFFSSGQTWYAVFWTPPKGGNAYYILAHQYMAARLNVEAGASAPTQVSSAIAQATAWFTGRSTTAPKGPARDTAINLAGILGSYNEGTTGPGHCSVSPSTLSKAAQ